MMAGHILLKVIMGFSTTLIGCTGLFFLLNYAPVMAILPLLVLEFLIAFVQSFIFTMLFCMYLDDSLNLHGDH
jgi:F0F1-type ATP synthase membrane subunit a